MERYLACSTAPAGDLQAVPEIVKLLPLGHVKTRKGDFEVDAESYKAMRRAMEDHGVDLVIDYEHQTLKDVQAPAAGWIKELILQEDAIAGRVEWTPTARQYLAGKEYRYLSPVVQVDRATGRACLLHSGALTNTPAIDNMYAIVSKDNNKDNKGGASMELLTQINRQLGLPEDADEAQAGAALSKALGELTALKAAKPAEAVPAALCEVLQLKAGADEGEAVEAAKKLRGALAERDAKDAVTLALKAGKICPAQQKWAMDYALHDPAGFAAYTAAAPQVVPMGETAAGDAVALKAPKLEDEALLALKQLGLTAADAAKYTDKEVQ